MVLVRRHHFCASHLGLESIGFITSNFRKHKYAIKTASYNLFETEFSELLEQFNH